MKKKIVTYIAMTMIISSAILSIIFWKVFQENELKVEISSLSISLSQVIESMKSNDEKLEQARELFVTDYLNRTQFAKNLVERDEDGVITESEWEEIIEILDVESVYVVSKDGIIVQSNNTTSLGLNFYTDSKLEKFIPLIEGKVDEGYYVQFDAISASTNEPMVYIGIEKEDGGIIQIEVNPKMVEEYEEMSSIKTLISNIPTRESRTIFVIDKETGELLGISKNNIQEIQMETENLTEQLGSIVDKPTVTNINGSPQLIMVREDNGNFIGYLSRMDTIYSNTKVYVLGIVFVLIIIAIVIIAYLYIMINVLVLDDIEKINKNAKKFVDGNIDVIFQKAKTKEISQLSESLNKVVQVSRAKKASISSIVSMIGEGFEAYEYYADINQVFYSENLPDMMSMSAEECEQAIRKTFKDSRLQAKSEEEIIENEDLIITKSGRMIKARRTILNKASFGFLEDITEEKERARTLEENLKIEREKNYIDDLTGLFNRKKLKEYIDEIIKQKKKFEGVMILMDLDNFKKVNDIRGHLEGDNLLRKFANIISTQFREKDIKARLGGDEFVVFIPNLIDKEILEKKVNSFLNVARKELSEYYLEYRLSVSLGVVYLDKDCHSFEDLYNCADTAMYEVKHKGKDSFYIHQDDNTCVNERCVRCGGNCKRRSNLFI